MVFLELNTSPMFARFDQVSGGKVCAAIIRELTSGIDPAMSQQAK